MAIKAEMVAYFQDWDIEEEFKERYGYDIEVPVLFWEGDYMNDSCKVLYFKDIILDLQYNEDKESGEMIAVCELIKEALPKDYGYDYVIIDVSW